jgi:hypothetical protein
MATTDRVQDRPENYRQPPKDAWSLIIPRKNGNNVKLDE